jgi:hypothetical protein
MMDQPFQPRCPARTHWDQSLVEAFGEDPSGTSRLLAAEPSRCDVEPDQPSRAWQIRDAPNVAAVDAPRTSRRISSPTRVSLSTINPRGIRDAIRKLARMVLILLEQRQASGKYHRM